MELLDTIENVGRDTRLRGEEGFSELSEASCLVGGAREGGCGGSEGCAYHILREMNNLVLDNGSSLLKAGLAATDIAPSIFCPTLIGVPHSTQQMSLLGLDALKKAGQYSLRYPIERGLIVNFEDTLELWRYVLQLAISDSRPDCLLMTEAPLNPRRNR